MIYTFPMNLQLLSLAKKVQQICPKKGTSLPEKGQTNPSP